MSYALSTHNLTRRFGTYTAVDRVSLEVPRGTVYGFLGPNGAGKSTTIRMLLGLLRPDDGHVALLGRPLTRHREAILQDVGALVEAPSLYGHLTGRENLEVTTQMHGGLPEAALDRALDLVDLRDAAHQRVRTYSLGMKQRLGLALALVHDPDLLILDEPTNGLDPAGMQDVRTLLRDLPERANVTVFLSTHLLGEVERIASHVGVIRKGRLVFQGATGDLTARQPTYVVIGTDEPTEARRVLPRDAGMECLPEPDSGDRLRVRPGTSETAARCAALLIEAGLAVHHLRVHRPSLEDVFLALTAPDTAAA